MRFLKIPTSAENSWANTLLFHGNSWHPYMRLITLHPHSKQDFLISWCIFVLKLMEEKGHINQVRTSSSIFESIFSWVMAVKAIRIFLAAVVLVMSLTNILFAERKRTSPNKAIETTQVLWKPVCLILISFNYWNLYINSQVLERRSIRFFVLFKNS